MSRMRLSLCNEVIGELPFERQCALAAELGYDGLEVAPFTFGDEPHLMSAETRAGIRRAAAAAGVRVSGLHWLLVKPAGLSLTSPDAALRARTTDVLCRLVALCAELEGDVLVHGSPVQRRLPDGPEAAAARGWAIDALARVGEAAAAAGVVYCLEPLSPRETNFVNTVAEAAGIVQAIGNPALRTMIDCSAAGLAEAEPVADLIDRWLPTGLVAHVQVNDRNRRGPGQGDEAFAPILAALARQDYRGWVAVEPFDYVPDGPGSAARAAGYLRGIEEALAWRGAER
ncbi:sugar phosphate isomerase/epimerase [Stella humosa]|uniref:Sugar phosphate isomerase/epimerase n=1 Tax=Stella humosa TaxID=94 RepID=A0A3N1M1F4_9PROT|nr:sugar phosphate isomerase/epimerase family protein [Stella humosa]ROQ01344.1 sugar phosphate isomerase/epimerase [Stella humosa]BBK31718.1 tagatose 3-epimerase [Stella humosa]